jgi:hypothetical protein
MRPCSTNCNTAAAVTVFVIEYAIMVVDASMIVARRRSADPAVNAITTPAAFTATY